MADQRSHSLATQLETSIAGHVVTVSILADTPQELVNIIHELSPTNKSAPQAQQEAAQQAQQEAAQPTPTPGPTAAQTAPAATAPAAATAPNAASAGTQTAAAPAQDSTPQGAPTVSLNDVLSQARQLLQKPGGEDTLGQILGQHGATSISTADPQMYPQIFNGISAALSA